jgi:hypothetical protein
VQGWGAAKKSIPNFRALALYTEGPGFKPCFETALGIFFIVIGSALRLDKYSLKLQVNRLLELTQIWFVFIIGYPQRGAPTLEVVEIKVNAR